MTNRKINLFKRQTVPNKYTLTLISNVNYNKLVSQRWYRDLDTELNDIINSVFIIIACVIVRDFRVEA